MKLKNTLLISSLCLGVILFFFSKSYAAYQIEVCEVIQAGTDAETGEVFFKLLPVGQTIPKKFIAPAGQENRMLAIGLSAMVSGMKVKADIDYANMGEILSLRLYAD